MTSTNTNQAEMFENLCNEQFADLFGLSKEQTAFISKNTNIEKPVIKIKDKFYFLDGSVWSISLNGRNGVAYKCENDMLYAQLKSFAKKLGVTTEGLDLEKYTYRQALFVLMGRKAGGGNIDNLDPEVFDDSQMEAISWGRDDDKTWAKIDDITNEISGEEMKDISWKRAQKNNFIKA